ncbi:MAG: hypothetical protein PHN61_05550 [Methanothrix sp.]|nr:hypothetical protein [Methanothrix sp.]
MFSTRILCTLCSWIRSPSIDRALNADHRAEILLIQPPSPGRKRASEPRARATPPGSEARDPVGIPLPPKNPTSGPAAVKRLSCTLLG